AHTSRPLFPYTTLFRSQAPTALGRDGDLAGAAVCGMGTALGQARALELIDQRHQCARIDAHRRGDLLLNGRVPGAQAVEDAEERSEEHTSELQSPYDLG